MYKVCSSCIMDTSDPHIEFDAEGVCNYCHNFNETIKPNGIPMKRVLTS